MKGRLLFVVGLGAGYVLGARAGRQRYEQIRAAARHVWDSPTVQKQVHTVQDFAADRIGDLGTVVTEGVKRAVTGSSGTGSRSGAATSSTQPTTSASLNGSGRGASGRFRARRRSGGTSDDSGGKAS